MKIDKTNGEEHLLKAVILGLYYTGYGIIRELSEYNIPIYVFDEDRRWPEKVTRLAKCFTFNSEQELLQKLTDFSNHERKKPVMYLASDLYVEFFRKHRTILEDYYLIDFPGSNVVDILLKKGCFARFAAENGYSTPKTFIINSHNDYDRYSPNITFPCVLKPFWRSKAWLNANLRKVYIFNSKSKLEKGLQYIIPVENNLIIQQYIPGDDREIYFHLMYYNSESKCVGEFTGRKLRQWPVGVGQTACAEPAPWATEVREDSIRLFNQLKYKGFGSVEFKKHSYENKFYIMEPTVGRQNAQSFIAAINGTRLSLIAYSQLTGVTVPAAASGKKKIFWIDDQYDLFSIAVLTLRGCLNIKDLFRSYLGKKKFRLFNLKDLRVGFYCWTVVLLNKLFQKITKRNLLKLQHQIRCERPKSEIPHKGVGKQPLAKSLY